MLFSSKFEIIFFNSETKFTDDKLTFQKPPNLSRSQGFQIGAANSQDLQKLRLYKNISECWFTPRSKKFFFALVTTVHHLRAENQSGAGEQSSHISHNSKY